MKALNEKMQMAPLKCPRCKIKMEKQTNGTFIIDRCTKCRGVWLDEEEISEINKQGFWKYVKAYFRKDKW